VAGLAATDGTAGAVVPLTSLAAEDARDVGEGRAVVIDSGLSGSGSRGRRSASGGDWMALAPGARFGNCPAAGASGFGGRSCADSSSLLTDWPVAGGETAPGIGK